MAILCILVISMKTNCCKIFFLFSQQELCVQGNAALQQAN